MPATFEERKTMDPGFQVRPVRDLLIQLPEIIQINGYNDGPDLIPEVHSGRFCERYF